MKIAVTYENGQVFQHFGHTEAFKVYEIEDGAVRTSRIIGTEGFGHGALAGFLREQGICVLICGGIGGGAINALQPALKSTRGSPEMPIRQLQPFWPAA